MCFSSGTLTSRAGAAMGKPGIVPDGAEIATPTGVHVGATLLGFSIGSGTKLLRAIGLRRDIMKWKINSTWHNRFVEGLRRGKPSPASVNNTPTSVHNTLTSVHNKLISVHSTLKLNSSPIETLVS